MCFVTHVDKSEVTHKCDGVTLVSEPPELEDLDARVDHGQHIDGHEGEELHYVAQ